MSFGVHYLISKIKKRNILFVFPHPDDETISCISIFRKLKERNINFSILWATNGYPKSDLTLNFDLGFYQSVRKEEFQKAKDQLKTFTNKFYEFDYYSREIVSKAKDFLEKLVKLVISKKNDTLFVCPFESSHPDHDLVNFLVSYANKKFFDNKLDLYEYSSYFMSKNNLVNNEFYDKTLRPVYLSRITNDDKSFKQKLFSIYRSQKILLSFSIKDEIFRCLPDYNYSKYTNPNVYYEMWQSNIRREKVLETIKNIKNGL